MYFEIQCNDLQRAIAFYKGVFDWTIERAAWAPIEYWDIATDGIRGALMSRPAEIVPSGAGTNAAVISMEVQSFDKVGAAVVAEGGTVAMPKFAVPGRCWQGYFFDTERNTFGVFEVDGNAR